jgi:protein-disulfide isomerase
VAFESEIYDDPGHVVLGNPDGDVTLVEFFDYNCGFCRRAMPDMAQLLAEDSNLRIILKEFPVLSENSVDAARVAVAVANTPDSDYWAFHELLFTSRGQISGETALAAAEQIGMNRVSIELDIRSEAVASILQRSYTLAQGLNITGTPAYIIGDEIIPGAVGVEVLRRSIANMRKCGSTICDT